MGITAAGAAPELLRKGRSPDSLLSNDHLSGRSKCNNYFSDFDPQNKLAEKYSLKVK
jgi:hypothetical protein